MMRLAPRKTDRRRPAADRRRSHPAPARVIEPAQPETRVRDAGGPEDTAHYACTCGFMFDAAVTTSVACPHCGTLQAW
jgi:hypothetical protein